VREIIASANLIVGNDGSTTANNSSIGLSTDEDRLRFQQLRSKSDLILIGGNTARREPYKRTLIPLYILTHAKVRLQPKNQLAKQFSMSITDLFSDISNNFPPTDSTSPINLLIEAGPVLLKQMIDLCLIDHLYLTKNLEKNGENRISIEELITPFKLMSSEKVGSCEFMHFQKISQVK
jgi:riboflavin biosynthesis pyrimidine reductase